MLLGRAVLQANSTSRQDSTLHSMYGGQTGVTLQSQQLQQHALQRNNCSHMTSSTTTTVPVIFEVCHAMPQDEHNLHAVLQ
jgi:hypothetical protein